MKIMINLKFTVILGIFLGAYHLKAEDTNTKIPDEPLKDACDQEGFVSGYRKLKIGPEVTAADIYRTFFLMYEHHPIIKERQFKVAGVVRESDFDLFSTPYANTRTFALRKNDQFSIWDEAWTDQILAYSGNKVECLKTIEKEDIKPLLDLVNWQGSEQDVDLLMNYFISEGRPRRYVVVNDTMYGGINLYTYPREIFLNYMMWLAEPNAPIKLSLLGINGLDSAIFMVSYTDYSDEKFSKTNPNFLNFTRTMLATGLHNQIFDVSSRH